MSTEKLEQKLFKPFTNPLLSKEEYINTSKVRHIYLNKLWLILLLVIPIIPTQAQGETVNCEGELWTQKSEIIARETVKKETTIPSLWWAKKHYDPFGGKLVSNWLAYPEEKRIDLIVDRQLWNSMDYLGRYRFVNQFGMITREYGYSLRVVNQEEKCLATYYYDASINPPKWEINLDTTGQSSLQLD